MKVTFFQKSVVITFSLDRLADSLQVTTWHRHYFYRMLSATAATVAIYRKLYQPTNLSEIRIPSYRQMPDILI